MSAQIYKKKKVRAIISRSMVLLGIVFLMSAMFTLQSSLNVPTAAISSLMSIPAAWMLSAAATRWSK